MSVTVTLNGTPYTIPSPGDANDWGAALNAYLVALSTAATTMTMGAVGSTPNSNGATITNSVLTLQPYSPGVSGGVVSAQQGTTLHSLGALGEGAVQTTTDTPTPINFSFPTPDADRVYVFEANVAAQEETGSADGCAAYGLIGVFQDVSGTLTQIGSTQVVYSKEKDAAWDCVMAVVANAVTVTATGAVATTINWRMAVRLLSYSQG